MRALLSVYDKEGLVGFARGLEELGFELVASGNTAAALLEAKIAHHDVASVTGSPEMLGGRVKTLHPAIHGGILADRSKPEHLADLEANGIEAIDLVVCNLYPFTSDPSIELIDVGGPTMVRAAAKNFAHVGIVVAPEDYDLVLSELRAEGSLSPSTRGALARKAFAHTASYDAAIVEWLNSGGPDGTTADEDTVLPEAVPLVLERAEILRYGENPHQRGARYRVEWPSDLVGRGHPARRHGAELSQPLRRRCCVAPGPRALGRRGRAACRGDHEARQRRAEPRWPSRWPTLSAPRWPRIPCRPSGGSWRCPNRSMSRSRH